MESNREKIVPDKKEEMCSHNYDIELLRRNQDGEAKFDYICIYCGYIK